MLRGLNQLNKFQYILQKQGFRTLLFHIQKRARILKSLPVAFT